MWITTEELRSALGLEPADTFDDEWLASTVDAVNALVEHKRPDIPGAAETVDDYPDVITGAVLLAVKVYKSRGSDNSEGYDLYTYPARFFDANILMLLGLDAPVIA